MGPVAKLERLRNAWLVYAVVIAIFEARSLFEAALVIGMIFGFAWFLTKQLVQKSSLVWAFGVVLGLIGAIGAALDVIDTVVDAADGRGFDFARFALAAASTYIHVQTFRVLRDGEVKRHVMLD